MLTPNERQASRSLRREGMAHYEKASLPVRFRVVPQVSKPYDPAALIKEIRLSVGLN
jgi:hypothetical protein